VARRLAALGADLCIQGFAPYDGAEGVGADPDGPAALVRALEASGRHVVYVDADFRDPAAPARVMAAARAALGHVDILVANHAYSTSAGLEDLTAEQIDTHLIVNVRGSLLLAQAFAAQHDDTRPSGRIILMTSGQHLGPMPSELAYIASKGALHQLTASLAEAVVRRQITVNTVNPGATDTGWATGELHAAIAANHPQGRWGQPDDAARLIGWLATDDAGWITGQVINSTGRP
jgi:3-oxoacyl-[acyl-carrier protein] reductase